jgi:hypothetical protein
MPKKKKIEKTDTSVETLAEEIVESVSKDNPQVEETVKYVVVRDDRRVSDNEYTDPKDPKAIDERDFWQRVCKRWSPGEKTTIVKYNKKRHRNW